MSFQIEYRKVTQDLLLALMVCLPSLTVSAHTIRVPQDQPNIQAGTLTQWPKGPVCPGRIAPVWNER